MKKLIIFLILSFSFSNSIYSQLSNKHWLPPLHANEDFDDDLVQSHYLYLSTPEPTPFAVTITDGGGTPITGSPFTISQNNPISILIGNQQPSVMFLDKINVGGVVSNKGLILEGKYDFYVSFRVRAANHAEFLSSKGEEGMGTVFRLGSLPQNNLGLLRNFVSSFMATEDNTTVNLSDYDPNIQFVIGNVTTNKVSSQSFNLNKGQSVVVSGYTIPSANFTGFIGALLTSNKPIVVNTGNMAGGMGTIYDGQDFNLDQIVPLEQVGTEYIVMKGNGSDLTEHPLVIAHENNTEIFINGSNTPIKTLNAGEYFLIPTNNFEGSGSNKNMYIKTSAPVFLYQIIGGSNADSTSGFYFIPPLSCFWQKSVDLIPDVNKIIPSDNNTQGNIIIATEAGSIVTINGVTTTQSPIPVTGNSNWESYRIPNLSGNVKIESTGALAVGVFGTDNKTVGFGGYFSGFGSLPRESETIICSTNIVNLFDRIPGNPDTNGTWEVPLGAPKLDGNLFDPNVNVPGEYIYTFSKTCSGETRLYPTKIIVLPIQEGPNAGVSSTQAFCTSDNAINLFTLLGSNIDAPTDAYWTFNNGTTPLPNGGLFDPTTDPEGDYTYIIPASGNCEKVSATITTTINTAPVVANPITVLEQCDTDTDAITDFNLAETNQNITTDVNLNISYHTSENGAINNTDIILDNDSTDDDTSLTYTAAHGDIIWARVENLTTGCFNTAQVNLVVSTNILPNTFNYILYECDDYVDATNTDTDGIDLFNLNDFENYIINSNLLPADRLYTFSYYTDPEDALTKQNKITTLSEFQNTTPNSQTLWVRIDSNLNNDCEALGQYLTVEVLQLPQVELGDDLWICLDPITGTGTQIIDATPAKTGNYTYVWSSDVNDLDLSTISTATYTATQPGTYTVIVTDNNITANKKCQNSDSITLKASSEPVSFTAEVTTPAFTGISTTIVGTTTGGYGSYEYSIDELNWQTSNTFYNLENGIYTIYVRDLAGCGTLSVSNLFAISYPNYFTPNGDGYHDTWNISNLSTDYNAKILIFDRYGKLIKQISPEGEGWDGTFNGQPLPGSDYWFTIEYTENEQRKEFKSHFSLKR